MTKAEFIELSEKYMAGKCTPDEMEMLRVYKDRITLQDDAWSTDMGDKDAIHHELRERLAIETNDGQLIRRMNYGWLKAASIILLIVTGGLLFYQSKSGLKKQLIVKSAAMQKLTKPGTQLAVLTLSNGEKIALNTIGEGRINSEQGTSIHKGEDGFLVYDLSGTKTNNNNLTDKYNTISTPPGGEYHLKLSDGTQVWLNAGSTLKFPVAFASNKRVVEITGEGYFEVKKDNSRPFLVNAGVTQVKVLGTHFNVSAYGNDQQITTTLLEGSVQLSAGTVSALLKPGQQGIAVRQKPSFLVQQADLESVVAWTKGNFVFNDVNIKDVMKIVARWYNVHVEYEGNVANKKFGGTTSRYSSITELLDNMALTGGIHYKIEGRKVTISN